MSIENLTNHSGETKSSMRYGKLKTAAICLAGATLLSISACVTYDSYRDFDVNDLKLFHQEESIDDKELFRKKPDNSQAYVDNNSNYNSKK